MERMAERLRLLAWLALAGAAGWAGTSADDLLALRAQHATQRATGRITWWAAELKFAEAHRNEPALAAEVIYEVALAQRLSERRQATRTLEALLEAHPNVQPWAALAAYEVAPAYADTSTTRPKAIELYEKFLKAGPADPVRRPAALLALGRLYKDASKPQDAMGSFQAVLTEFPDHARACAEASASVGLLLVEQKQPKDALGIYKKLSTEYPWEREQRNGLLLAIAQALRTAEDREGATEAYEKLLQELPRGDARRSQVYAGLAMLYVQQQQAEKAMAAYRRMAEDRTLSDYYRASAYRQLFEFHHRANDDAAIIRLAYQVIAAHPMRVLDAGNAIGELVDALINEGRIDEGIGAAKAYLRLAHLSASLASPSSPGSHSGHSSGAASPTQGAIFAVVRALKAKEGSLRAANRFIAFVENGREGLDGKLGTADDIEDPTAGYRLPPEPERDRLFEAAAKRLITDPCQLGYLYICWDKPDEAVQAFRHHYLAAAEATKLQAAATLLAHAMRALGRPEADVDAFFEFQNYGPNGKDGKPNTKDDLKDPILGKK